MLLVIVFAAYDGSQVLLVAGLRAEMLLDCSMDTTCLIHTILRPMANTGKDSSIYHSKAEIVDLGCYGQCGVWHTGIGYNTREAR